MNIVCFVLLCTDPTKRTVTRDEPRSREQRLLFSWEVCAPDQGQARGHAQDLPALGDALQLADHARFYDI
jgi:hypothetical protein